MMYKVLLNGHNLTLADIKEVVLNCVEVEISEEAKKRLVDSRQLVFDLVDSNVPIYGFNTGVGWNKDKKVMKEFFQEYNRNLILAHCVSVGEEASEKEIRAIMLCRLNELLVGCTGLSPEIPQMYADMLNFKIHPVVPERGSIGEGDIGLLSHIGLAMMGEGEVTYKGKRMDSLTALKAENLQPIVLGPKDGLAIVSSNSFAAGQAACALLELKDFMDIAEIVYAMSLEALNGNTSPLDPETHIVRPYKGQMETAKRVSKLLEGSYIYDLDPEKPVQDPLSFRDTVHIYGAVQDAMEFAEKQLLIQFNSSDDNPCLVFDKRKIMSCANFEPLAWVLAFEMLNISLGHVAKVSCLRTIKLGTPEFTRLNRFLSKRPETICFSTVQKTFMGLFTEISNMINPASLAGLPVAGDIEDVETNATFVVQKTRKIIDTLRYILGIEMLHAAQAFDLREGKKFSIHTKKAYDIVRKTIPFYDYDRNLTIDINKAYDVIKSRDLIKDRGI